MKYAIRIPANDSLERDIAELLPRPVGRPSQKPLVEYKGFLYQAASWKTAWRVVAKVEHHAGELFPRVGFIVTNLNLPSRAVVRFHNKRGTVEQWIKEGKQAVKMTRLSCHRFRSNEVRLWLSVIAYNLGNLWRRGAAAEDWELVADQLAAAVGEDRWSPGETCSLLVAAAGRESPDAATVRGHATADRVAAPAGGIGQLPTEPVSVAQGGTDGTSVADIGRKRVSFELWDSAERQNWPVPWPVEAPGSANPADSCMQWRSGVRYRPGEN